MPQELSLNIRSFSRTPGHRVAPDPRSSRLDCKCGRNTRYAYNPGSCDSAPDDPGSYGSESLVTLGRAMQQRLTLGRDVAPGQTTPGRAAIEI